MELAVIGYRLCEPLTGVGRYLQALLYQWSRLETPFRRVVVYCPREPNIPPDAIRPPVELRIVRGRLSSLLSENLLLWENLVLPPAMDPCDLLFAPYTLPWSCSARRPWYRIWASTSPGPAIFPSAGGFGRWPVFITPSTRLDW